MNFQVYLLHYQIIEMVQAHGEINLGLHGVLLLLTIGVTKQNPQNHQQFIYHIIKYALILM